MSDPRRWWLSLAVTLGACTQAAPPAADGPPGARAGAGAAVPVASAPFEPVAHARELALHRGGCYGPCPVYSVVIDALGEVWYDGGPFAARQGVHTGQVAPAAVHQVLRGAIEGGYFAVGDDHDDGVEDTATTFTSVALEQRRWVRNHSRDAPAVVPELERAIDGLLAATAWSPAPPASAPADDACPQLARALADRCAAYLELRGAPGDCPYFLHLRTTLERGDEATDAGLRCARQLRSLELTTPAPLAAPRPALGRICEIWAQEGPGACLAALRDGQIAARPCAQVVDTIAALRALDAGDPAALRLRMREERCKHAMHRLRRE